MNKLEQLKTMTKVVADTGDVDSIKQIKPIDATTNPSLILQAAKLPQYQSLIKDAIRTTAGDIGDTCDQLIVNFGCEILKVIPGRISSEVDARLSFDIEASVDKGRKLIQLYHEAGIPKERVLIKLASTWQGIKAAEQLEKEGIACNLTLLFSMTQAIACADANVTLISPFVGRILDWYKKNEDKNYTSANDPGVQSVTNIFNYYKSNGIKTVVMGASFRNIDEILELAGCDLLTISPALLEELNNSKGVLEQKLLSNPFPSEVNEIPSLSRKEFDWQLNENAMAIDKLSEGIRNFAKDQCLLEELVLRSR